MPVKTDRNDARAIAQIVRTGWFRAVHLKSVLSQEVRGLLGAGKLLIGKVRDLDNAIRALLRGFGLKVGKIGERAFAKRARELVEGGAALEAVLTPLLAARAALLTQRDHLHRLVLAAARNQPVCRRLMSVPGVGPVTALTFCSVIDDPSRFTRSRAVGVHFGLTPSRYQSGETDRTGHISKQGDALACQALYEAANVLLTRTQRWSALKAWGMAMAKRAGMRRAKLALALAAIQRARSRRGDEAGQDRNSAGADLGRARLLDWPVPPA